MIELSCDAVLLDIEGTVSPVSFVYDEMFPYVRSHLGDFLKSNWQSNDVRDAVNLVAQDVGQASSTQWFEGAAENQQQQMVCTAVSDMMDRDAKVTGLKQLQGLVWRSGFESGQLVSHLFADVVPQIKLWREEGIELHIYSSGSVGAQKLFFGHTTAGNLLALFSGFFDTTVGNKRQGESYLRIAESMGHAANRVVFISDLVDELDAAKSIGMQTIWRPAGSEKVESSHASITSFADIDLDK